MTAHASPRSKATFAKGSSPRPSLCSPAYVKEAARVPWGWYALGYSRFAQQKIGDSNALAKSLELDVRNAEAHKILGRDLMIIGRFDAAQIEFEQAIRYKPDSAESSLQPRQAVFGSGQLGAGAKGVRVGAAS